MHILRVLLFAALTFGLSSCSSSRDPILYHLKPPQLVSSVPQSELTLLLREVSVPAYARNTNITSSTKTHRIVEDDEHKWAVPPSEAITNALAASLEVATGGVVTQHIESARMSTDAKISVHLSRLLRSQDGGVEMVGQFIVSDDGKPSIKRFSLKFPGKSRDYDGYMEAVADAVDELARLIAAEVIEP